MLWPCLFRKLLNVARLSGSARGANRHRKRPNPQLTARIYSLCLDNDSMRRQYVAVPVESDRDPLDVQALRGVAHRLPSLGDAPRTASITVRDRQGQPMRSRAYRPTVSAATADYYFRNRRAPSIDWLPANGRLREASTRPSPSTAGAGLPFPRTLPCNNLPKRAKVA